MKLPTFLYGLYRDVKPRCRKLVTRLRRGTPWSELPDDYVDTRDVPGLLVLHGPYPNLGFEPHFQLFVPLRIAEDAMPDRLGWEYEKILFDESLKTIWGVLGLASDGGQGFIYPASAQDRLRFIRAMVRFWDELDAEGERYSLGGQTGQSLWSLPTMLHYCLINAGIPKERMHAPLPPGGLKELVAEIPGGLPED